MTDDQLDQLLCKAIIQTLDEEWSPILADTPQLEPSLKYQVETKKMLDDHVGWYRKKTRPIWRKAMRTVASVAVVSAILFGTVMAASPTVRAAVLQWVTEWYETHVVYRYTGEVNDSTPSEYEITDIPSGYALVDQIEFPGYQSIIYQNDTGTFMYFDTIYMDEGIAMGLLISDVECYDVTVNGFPGTLYISEADAQSNHISWIVEENGVHFIIEAHLSAEDLLYIAESVKIK